MGRKIWRVIVWVWTELHPIPMILLFAAIVYYGSYL